MKKLLYIFYFTSVVSSSLLASSAYTIPLIPAQINNRGYYVISQPGNYILTDNLNFYPTGYTDGETIPNESSIIILCDNVHINLNGNTISHISSKDGSELSTNNVSGITIASGGIKNITIENGTFNKITGSAITCGFGASNITLKNLTIMHCASAGIKLYGDEGLAGSIQNVTIDNCTISNCNGTLQANGYYLGDTYGDACGIDMHYVSNSVIKNSTCTNNSMDTSITSYSSANSVAAGVRMQHCQTIKLSNVQSNNHEGMQAYGFLQIESHNLTYEQCQAHENHNTILATVSGQQKQKAAGFMLQGSSTSLFERCIARHNYAITWHAAGFYIDGTYTNSEEEVIPTTYITFTQCQAINNIAGYTQNQTTYGAGFLSLGNDIDIHNYSNMWIECHAQGNDAQSNSISSAYNIAAGICLIFEQASIIEKCHCMSNGSITDTNIQEIIADVNYTIPLVRGYGIYLGPEGQEIIDNNYAVDYTYSKHIIIKGCWVMFNSHVGIKDDGLDCQSLITQNYAFRNGTQNQKLIEGSLGAYATNYSVNYLQPNEHLATASSSVGDLSALNTSNPYTNVEWQSGPPSNN